MDYALFMSESHGVCDSRKGLESACVVTTRRSRSMIRWSKIRELD